MRSLDTDICHEFILYYYDPNDLSELPFESASGSYHFTDKAIHQVLCTAQLCHLKSETYRLLKVDKKPEEWLLMARLIFQNIVSSLKKFDEELHEEIILEYICVNLAMSVLDERILVCKYYESYKEDYEKHKYAFHRLWISQLPFVEKEGIKYFQKSLQKFGFPLHRLIRYLKYVCEIMPLQLVPIQQKKNYLFYKNSLLINSHFKCN